MSGLEVVGLVLGVIPLIISGLEHYEESVATIKVVRHAAAEFRTLIRKLAAEQTVFSNTIKILLDDCVGVDDQTAQALMGDVGGTLWASSSIHCAVKERLRSSLKSFCEHVNSIAVALDSFKQRLHIGSNGQVPFSDAFTFREAYKRFHFALKKSEYLDLIKEIRNDNNRLQTLTDQARTLETASKKPRRAPDFSSTRSNAQSVFECLQKVLRGPCVATHRASIYLDASGNQASSSSTAFQSFRIVLHHDHIKPKQSALLWSIEEAEIRLLEPALPIPVQPTKPVVSKANPAKKRRVVAFQISPEPVATVAAAPQNVAEILDLCKTFSGMRMAQSGPCIGYLAGTSGHSACRHGVYRPDKRLVDDKCLSVESLAKVFDRLSPVAGMKWTDADARRLAAPLALGILRLHGTPWLDKSWSKSDIRLILQDGKLLSGHPFVSRDLPPAANTGIPAMADKSTAALFIRNETLFSLGIILIEMCMRKDIAELALSAELDPSGIVDDVIKFRVAKRLLDDNEIHDTFGQRWNEVVRRCIFCDLNYSKTSLADVGFQNEVYTWIFAELEEERRTFFGIT